MSLPISRRASALPLAVALIAFAGCLTVETDAEAQRVIHRVRFGDTLKKIARYYYDKAEYAYILGVHNGRSPGDKLRAGQRLRVPTAWRYVVKRNTTLPRLAQKLLKASARATALRAFNPRLGGGNGRSRIKAGTVINVPFTIDHLAGRGDNFLELSKLYYGTPALEKMLAEFNFTKPSATIRAGSSLVIPIAHVRISAIRLRGLINKRLLGVESHDSRDEYQEGLQEANAMLRRGDYWNVPVALVKLLAKQHPADASVAEVYKLLAIAYVAFGQLETAQRCFGEALARNPGLRVNIKSVSPKIYRQFEAAKREQKRAGR